MLTSLEVEVVEVSSVFGQRSPLVPGAAQQGICMLHCLLVSSTCAVHLRVLHSQVFEHQILAGGINVAACKLQVSAEKVVGEWRLMCMG